MTKKGKLLNYTFLMQKKYLIKENTYIEKINIAILFIVLTISVVFLMYNNYTENSMLKIRILFLGFVVMFCVPVILYILQYYKIRNTINSGKGEIISRNTDKIYRILPKAIIIYSMFLITGVVVMILYLNNSDIDDIKLKSLIFFSFLGMCSGLIKAYLVDRIVVFKNESFISGFDEVKYKKVSSVKEVKRFRGIPEDLITIEFSFAKKCVGFDKFLESDYNYLFRKVLETNREVK